MLPAVAIGMYTYGADATGDYCALIAFIAAIVSHFPKRFMFRTRPYLVNRALKANVIHTSSFPSRAVVAGAIYTVVLI